MNKKESNTINDLSVYQFVMGAINRINVEGTSMVENMGDESCYTTIISVPLTEEEYLMIGIKGYIDANGTTILVQVGPSSSFTCIYVEINHKFKDVNIYMYDDYDISNPIYHADSHLKTSGDLYIPMGQHLIAQYFTDRINEYF